MNSVMVIVASVRCDPALRWAKSISEMLEHSIHTISPPKISVLWRGGRTSWLIAQALWSHRASQFLQLQSCHN